MMNKQIPESLLHKKHPLIIPAGRFCYRVLPTEITYIIKMNSPRLGLDVREAGTGTPGEKFVLCPYWERTDYGTVRCGYQNREVEGIGMGDFTLAMEKLGFEESQKLQSMTLLADKIKE
jgi:hypothetical protein